LVIQPVAIAQSPVEPNNAWVQVITSNVGWVYYIDTASLRTNGDRREFWSSIANPKGMLFRTQGRAVYAATIYWSVDCQQRTYAWKAAQLLDENADVLDEFDVANYAPSNLSSDQVRNAIVSYACTH
jgi:hypothetical protein